MKLELDDKELEATKNREKTSDEMFEKLGYIYHFENSYAKVYKKGCRQYNRQIAFNIKTKRIMCPYYLSIQELQAINKKVQELRLVESWCRYVKDKR